MGFFSGLSTAAGIVIGIQLGVAATPLTLASISKASEIYNSMKTKENKGKEEK